MAVTSTPVSTDLVLVMNYGTSASGKLLSKDRVFKSINPLANNENLYSAAQELLSLQEKANLSIQRRDVAELTQA